jgi:hypothetical protein
MIALKLKQLPDRQSEKMVILVSADLKLALSDYARVYAKTYGAVEDAADLVPYMLNAFLKFDYAFQKARRDLVDEQDQEPTALPLLIKRGRRKSPDSATPAEEDT